MEGQLKVKFKIGEIEFEAEGSPEDVEKERTMFVNTLLPAAVDAMVHTRGAVVGEQYLDTTELHMLPENSANDLLANQPSFSDLSRTSLSSFIKKYGTLNEQDFTLFSAYFYEKKLGTSVFSIEDVKKYYAEARRPLPSNPSMSLNRLAEKGYIMDAPDAESKGAKKYILADGGIAYIETYSPKEDVGEKKQKKTRKNTSKVESAYSILTADDLNLNSYPSLKLFNGAKEQIVLAMYIVTKEEKGEWFTVADIEYLLTNIFELPSNTDMINGVFKRNKASFKSEQDPNNKKAFRRKLLSGAKDFAEQLIASGS